MNIKVFDRKNDCIYEEKVFGKKALDFLYKNWFGNIILKFVILSLPSKIYGYYNKSRLSKKKIEPFVKKYDIDLEEYDKNEYSSFNDFFIRKRKKESINLDKDALISPADSKLLVYNIDEKLNFTIKKNNYSISELLKDEKVVDEYKNGQCLIFRLSVDDYHRYVFIDNGSLLKSKTIKGKLHTVGPIATDKHRVYSENYRVVNYLDTENFGEIAQIEVGALLVKKIINYDIKDFKKGNEKGYFELGGSTIIILLKENLVKIDKDILEYSKKGIETKLRLGEKIGLKVNYD